MAERALAGARGVSGTARHFHIGTSGWHYKHWIGPFYPRGLSASNMLAWYAERFETVEINNSFYRMPSEAAVRKWAETVPPDFRFAVKASRYITHMKKLKDPEAALQRFLPVVEGLRRKLGPILFQLPPQWPPDLERFSAFLDALPPRHRYAFEFRNPEWHADPVYRLLEKRRAAFCIFDMAGFASPVRITAKFAYVRLHGPGGKYQGRYSRRELERWAGTIERWRLADVFVYFDNDERGFAVRNAAELQRMLAGAAPETLRPPQTLKR